MKKQLLWLGMGLVVTGCSKKQKEIHPEVKQLTSAVYASGVLIPEAEYKVVSGVDGYLSKALVREGDKVGKGQLLFTLSSEVRQAQEQGAGALVQQTIPTVSSDAPMLNELRGQIELAKLKKNEDSLQYARFRSLYEQNAVAKTTYERYQLQYQTSLRDYKNLRQRYEQQKLSGTIQLQQVKNQLSVARAQTDYGRLKSFVNGTVYEVYKKEGDLVMPNQPVALIGTGAMIAKLLVDENDLSKIGEGQKVLITMDAYPEKVFNAHIRKIYPLLSKVEQSFRVDAVMDDPVPVAMYGLNLEANIVIAENKSVLVIPKEALLKGDSVLVKVGGDEKKVKIAKGIEDDQWVEVTGGIDKDATVIIEL
jgi:HlyD family secretion protein